MSSEARDARDDLDSFYSKMLELVDMVPAPKIQIKQDMNYGRFLANTLRGFRILLNVPQFYKILLSFSKESTYLLLSRYLISIYK